MRIWVWLVVAACCSVPFLTACDSSDDDDSLVVTERDNGSTVEMSVGERLEVVLQGNATTGYEWQPTHVDSSILALRDSMYEPDSDAIGAGGEYTFVYEAVGMGSTSLKLSYHRIWEGGSAQTFSVTVVVR